jgi:tetratricopeptide (TPR) repeat protein
VQYWENQYVNIEKSLSSLNPENVSQTLEELNLCKEIAASIDSFLVKIKNQLNTSLQALFDTFYAPLFEKIKVNPDYQLMARVVSISFMKDPTKRLSSIIRLQKRRPDIAQNATLLGIIASSYRDLGQPSEAVKYYKAALSSDAMYYAAWNNLGRIYQLTYLNYEEAKKAFEKAIECKPDFDIPRLNLGVLLSSEFKDYDGAKKQYEEILKFDVNNPKAHHNLSNIYRANDFRDLDRAEYHLKIAVRQNLLEAVLSYANFLKVHRKEIEKGNQYYLKAKQLDVHGLYSREIELMLKSTRG